MVLVFSRESSILNCYLAELRDEKIHHDAMRFRRNLERFGECMAYEISQTMAYVERKVSTPLGESTVMTLKDQPVVGAILRAGLPMHQGVLNVFDHADSVFISAYRKHHKDGTFDISIEYVSGPDLNGRTLILCDPMLATGASIVRAYDSLKGNGRPAHLHVASVLASNEGISYAQRHLPGNTSFWIGAIDEELTAEAYIVPGLGDAGDLAYGKKI